MTTYGILAFPNVEELDAIGPWEVFGASKMVHDNEGKPGDNVFLIAENASPIRCNKGLHVVPDYTFENHPHLDVVLVPGGFGTRVEVNNPILIEWLQTVAAKATWVTSVCTGSLLLHGAGIAKDKNVATHHGFEDQLEARGNITVVRDQRWVVDGNVVSSQGVSAGIDMALWLIGQIDTPAHALAVQHYIQYDPAPPYQDLIDA